MRVTTTDGWNTATAESGAFAIGGGGRRRQALSQDCCRQLDTVETRTARTSKLRARPHERPALVAGRPQGRDRGMRDLWVDERGWQQPPPRHDRYGRVHACGLDPGLGQLSPSAGHPLEPQRAERGRGPRDERRDAVPDASGERCRVPARRRGRSCRRPGHGFTRKADGTECVSATRTRSSGERCMSLSPDQRSGVVDVRHRRTSWAARSWSGTSRRRRSATSQWRVR